MSEHTDAHEQYPIHLTQREAILVITALTSEASMIKPGDYADRLTKLAREISEQLIQAKLARSYGHVAGAT